MLTAILPIRRSNNTFWRSARGLACIDSFLKACGEIPDIQKYIVVTDDEQVQRLATGHGMMLSDAQIPGSIDKAYTFEQTHGMALCFKEQATDALIILDHRNLFLSADVLAHACLIHKKFPASGVISLRLCMDYPCQYKAFFRFLDCAIIPFGDQDDNDDVYRRPMRRLIHENRHFGSVRLHIHTDHIQCGLFFSKREMISDGVVARIIPYGEGGPLYERHREALIVENGIAEGLRLDEEEGKITGIILILTLPSGNGVYDTVEVFVPPKATWELGGPGSNIINSYSREQMIGRQQYPPIYSYDGSLCIMNLEQLTDKPTVRPAPLILEDSCIVTDWVDYLYAEQSL